MTSSLLRAQQLSCERNERLLFEDLTLSVNESSVLQITGPNGAGKTTLLRILCGLMPVREGEFIWRGNPVIHPLDYVDELIFISHRVAVKDRLTPHEMLEWFASLRGWPIDTVAAILAEVGLRGYEETPCSQLSAGQKRRTGLAFLRLANVPLWILDEPFTALDVDGTRMLENWISEQVQQGGSVIFTTHQKVNLRVEHFAVLDIKGA